MNIFGATTRSLATLSFVMFIFALLLASPLVAKAQVNVVVNGGSGTNAERQLVTLNSTIQGLLQQLVTKEYQLDPAANNAGKQAAVAYYNQQRQFIATGNNGKPFFIENLEVYSAQLRATTTNQVINELKGSGMCDAFEDEVIAALKKAYIAENAKTVAQKNSCEIDTVSQGKTEAFLDGKFEEGGGLQALWSIIQDPSNTPVGSFLENRALIQEQADEVEENALIRANWGEGLKDQYSAGQDVIVCTQGEENGIRDNCKVATPATLIRERAAALLNIEGILKTSADELGETEHNMIEQAVSQTMVRGVTGQAFNPPPAPPGTTNPTNPTTPTNPTNPTNPTTPNDPCLDTSNDPKSSVTQACLVKITRGINESGVSANNPIKPVIIRTLTKLQYQLQTISIIDNAEDKHKEAIEKYQSSGCYTLGFPNNLQNERTLTLTEAPPTVDAVKKLYAVFLAYESAVRSGASTATVLASFQTLLNTTFAIPSTVDLTNIANKFNEYLGLQITNFNTQHNAQVSACEAAGGSS